MALTISANIRDRGWVQLGTMSAAGLDPVTGFPRFSGYGVQPGSISYDTDIAEYGCLEASWKMKLDPRFLEMYGYLEHFTPVVIEAGSDSVWSGRIISVATNYGEDADLTVSAQGWGQHLKDQSTAKQWVVTDLSELTDLAQAPGVVITDFNSAHAPNVGESGFPTIPIPRGSTWIQNRGSGLHFDFGPVNRCKEARFDFRLGATIAGSMNIYVVGSDVPMNIVTGGMSYEVAFGPLNSYPGNTLYSNAGGVFSTPRRYVSIYYVWSAATTTSADDYSLRIERMALSTGSAYLSSGTSALKASTVVSEVLDECCPLISTDRSLITTTSFSIPNFPGSAGRRFPNELLDKANSFEGWLARLTPEPTPRMSYGPMPSSPMFFASPGIDPGVTWQEPAAMDGRGVYSRVISEYESADGTSAESQATSAAALILSTSQPPNPSFVTDTSGWSASGGSSFSRNTTVYNSAPASGAATTSASGAASFSMNSLGWFSVQRGRNYRMSFRFYRAAAITASGSQVSLSNTPGSFTASTDAALAAMIAAPLNTWTTITIDFVGNSTGVEGLGFILSGAASTLLCYLDDFTLYEYGASVVERRGFTRDLLAPIGFKSTAAAAAQIAGLKLGASKYPQVNGTLSVKGTIRTVGGGTMAVELLPQYVGEVVMLENMTDENTLAMGRQATIRNARYEEDTDTTTLSLDADTSSFIDNLKNRMQVLIGG